MLLVLAFYLSTAGATGHAQSLDDFLQSDSGLDACVNQRELYPDGTQCTTLGDRRVCIDEFRRACKRAANRNGITNAAVLSTRSGRTEIPKESVPDEISAEKDTRGEQLRDVLENMIEPDQAKRKMTDKQMSALYKDFAADQLPTGAQVTFTDWAVPANSACANEKTKDLPSGKLKCGACTAKSDAEVRRLGSYELGHVSAGRSFTFQKETLVMTLKGKGNDITLKCSPIDAMPTTPDVVAALAKVGIKLAFPYPKEAQLRVNPAPGSAPTSAF